MTKRDKILIGLMLVIIMLLAIGVFSLTNKIATLENSIQTVANIRNIEPIVRDGINGKDGLSITGEKGDKGDDGVDSLSTHSKETIIKEVPVIIQPKDGRDGADGVSPPDLDIQVNPETGDLQTKKSNYKFWTTLVPCEKLLVVCPSETSTKQPEAL